MTAIEEAREALAYLTASMDGRPGDGSPTLGQSVPRAETALRALIAEHERVSEERDRWKVEYERSEAARQVALKGARRLSVPPSDDEREAMSDLDTARSEALMDAADDDALVEELVDAVMCVDEEPFKTWRYRMEAAIKKVLRRQGPITDETVAALEDARAAHRVAGEAADRFRDVVCEVLGLDENPGDDELIARLREMHGKSGPEPRRWRDFLAGAKAHVEREGFRWRSDAALGPEPTEQEKP